MAIPIKPPDEVLKYIYKKYNYDCVSGVVTNTKNKVLGYNYKNRLRAKIKGKDYFLTNICWFLYYGTWPDSEIDHKDRDATNNSIGNLRKASHSENAANKDKRLDNKYHGVSYHHIGEKWRYRFIINKTAYEVYGFKTAKDAAKAREQHLDQLGDTFCARNKDLG